MHISFLAFLLLASCATIDINKGWSLHKTKGYNYKFLLCKNYKIDSVKDLKDYTGRGLPIKLLNKCVLKVCKTKSNCTFHGKSKLKKEASQITNPSIIIL